MYENPHNGKLSIVLLKVTDLWFCPASTSIHDHATTPVALETDIYDWYTTMLRVTALPPLLNAVTLMRDLGREIRNIVASLS